MALEEYLLSYPNDALMYNSLAVISGKLGNIEDNIQFGRKAISLDPNYYAFYVNLGDTLVSSGKYDEAQELLSKAVELAPNQPEPLYTLGILADAKNELETAIEFYRKATDVDPKYLDAWFNLAATLADVKKYKEANDAIERYFALSPGEKDSTELRRRIRKGLELDRKKK